MALSDISFSPSIIEELPTGSYSASLFDITYPRYEVSELILQIETITIYMS